MEENPKFNRQPTRLSGYDYSLPGHYFVTICTADKQKTLSAILVGEGAGVRWTPLRSRSTDRGDSRDLAPPVVKLSEIGKIADEQILKISERFPLVTVEKYVIMPNHIHLLLWLKENKNKTDNGQSRTPVSDGQSRTPVPTMRDRMHRLFCVHIVIKYTPTLL